MRNKQMTQARQLKYRRGIKKRQNCIGMREINAKPISKDTLFTAKSSFLLWCDVMDFPCINRCFCHCFVLFDGFNASLFSCVARGIQCELENNKRVKKTRGSKKTINQLLFGQCSFMHIPFGINTHSCIFQYANCTQ